jgi:hypothetical protein
MIAPRKRQELFWPNRIPNQISVTMEQGTTAWQFMFSCQFRHIVPLLVL